MIVDEENNALGLYWVCAALLASLVGIVACWSALSGMFPPFACFSRGTDLSTQLMLYQAGSVKDSGTRQLGQRGQGLMTGGVEERFRWEFNVSTIICAI